MKLDNVTMTKGNGVGHTIDASVFNEMKSDIAYAYGEAFYNAYTKYQKQSEENHNAVNLYDTITTLLFVAKNVNVDDAIVAFLTATDHITLDGKACTEIANRLSKSKVANTEKTNLPTYYKFFKRAGNRNETITITYKNVNEGEISAEHLYEALAYLNSCHNKEKRA